MFTILRVLHLSDLGGSEAVCMASEPSWRGVGGCGGVNGMERRVWEGGNGLMRNVRVASIRGLRWSSYHAKKQKGWSGAETT